MNIINCIVNIINCVSCQYSIYKNKVQSCTNPQQDNAHECIRVEKYEEKLHYSDFYILAASITCSFDRLFHNNKGGHKADTSSLNEWIVATWFTDSHLERFSNNLLANLLDT